jgi:hypothetical protein
MAHSSGAACGERIIWGRGSQAVAKAKAKLTTIKTECKTILQRWKAEAEAKAERTRGAQLALAQQALAQQAELAQLAQQTQRGSFASSGGMGLAEKVASIDRWCNHTKSLFMAMIGDGTPQRQQQPQQQPPQQAQQQPQLQPQQAQLQVQVQAQQQQAQQQQAGMQGGDKGGEGWGRGAGESGAGVRKALVFSPPLGSMSGQAVASAGLDIEHPGTAQVEQLKAERRALVAPLRPTERALNITLVPTSVDESTPAHK